MKKKKFERQQREKQQREEQRRQEYLNNMRTVVLRKDNSFYGNYRWNCPNHDGTFSWSKSINAKWGHPDDRAFCVACCTYFKIEFEDEMKVMV